MAITERSSDFTQRDFDSWILELRARVNGAFPSWTDFNIANFGNILLEMYAHTLDVISFTQDQQYKERFVSLATLLDSMINLGKNFAFALPGASAALADLEFTIADGSPRVSDITIPAQTIITTDDVANPISFSLLADVVILAGQTQSSLVSAENAFQASTAFTGTGLPNQAIALTRIPYVESSAVITVATFAYTEVANFLNSAPSDKHYAVDIQEDDTAIVRFGNGINGLPPNGSGTIIYKTGGGVAGNVDANTLVVFDDKDRFNDNQGRLVRIVVRNPSASSGGLDRMSVEEARVAIPASIRTAGNRSVSKLDFEDNARLVRGVARSLMVTSDEDPSIPENTGKLYVIPLANGIPSLALKNSVTSFINTDRPPTLTFSFSVEDPVLKIIPVTADVSLNVGITEAVARASVEQSLDTLFSLVDANGKKNEQIDFGLKLKERQPAGSIIGELPWSDIFNAVRDAATDTGALVFRKVENTTFIPSGDVPVGDISFPILGAILLNNIDTGSPL